MQATSPLERATYVSVSNMFREMKRLYSYSHDTWLHEPGKPCASRLARIGFYYNHLDHMVTCYCCLLTLQVVDVSENIETEHTRLSPQCDMQSGTATDNVSLISPECVLMKTVRYYPEVGTLDDVCYPEVGTNDDIDQPDALGPLKKLSNINLRSIYNQFIKAFDRAKKSGAVRSSANIHSLSANVSAACSSSISGSAAICEFAGSEATSLLASGSQSTSQSVIKCKPDFEQLKSEEARLKTFKDWPMKAHAEPRLLAATGLFYTGPGDRVQCAFCHVCLNNWEIGDVPQIEHQRHSSRCVFLRERDAASRITDQSLRLQTLSLMESDSKTTKPKHPEFASLDVRVQSFIGKQVPQGQNVRILASAGFYHVGPQDNVKCFFCDGGLKNWEPTDDPWREHEEHFPRCSYLTSVRNEKSILSVQHHNQPSSNLLRSVTGISSADFSVADSISSSRHFSFEPREIKARLDSPAVKAVLNIGYSRDIVRQAIEKKLSETGDDFPNTESLVEAVINLQEHLDPNARLPGMSASRVPVGASSSPSAVSAPLSIPSASLFTFLNRAADAGSSTVQASSHAGEQELTNLVTDVGGSGKSSKKSKKTRRKRQKANQGDKDAATNVDDEESELKDAAAMDTLFQDPEEEARRLIEENLQLKEAKLCKVCMDKENNTVFLPCGHLTCCDTCAPELKNCPICRAFIRGTVKVFLP